MVVGSDIIYSKVVLQPLARTIAYHLKGIAFIANNMVRYDNYSEQFEIELVAAGLQVVDRIDIKDEGNVMRLLIIKKK